MILHTCSRTHTLATAFRGEAHSVRCRVVFVVFSPRNFIRFVSPAPAVSATRCEQHARVRITNYRARMYVCACVRVYMYVCARARVLSRLRRQVNAPNARWSGGTTSATFQRRLKRRTAHMYRAVGEGRRWVKGDVGRTRAERREGTGYSHVGIVWGTPRVNADAVGIGVETMIRANINVTCKFLSVISLSLAKDSQRKILPREE